MPSVDSSVLADLVHLLEEIPGMEKPDVRATLLVFGFSPTERSRFRSSDDMHIDLVNIINYAADLGRLDDLIVNARGHPQDKNNRDKLNGTRGRLKSAQWRSEVNLSSDIVESTQHPDANSIKFDVFLCHNSKDKPAVKAIGEQLKKRGLVPWLDEWELRPGLPWQKALEEQIENITAAAVFVGPSGFGPWQDMELEAFLRQFKKRGCPVIPVILPGCTKTPKLPVFLEGMTWVDFRKKDPDPLKQLIWGITGKRPSRKST